MKTTFAEEYIRNGNLCQVQISDILKAMNGENFRLNLSSSDSESVYLALKTGIDSHLEACYVPSRGDRFEWSKGRLSGEISPESMPTLLRRLFESDCENAWSLADSILTVLGFDDYGRFVGRED